METQTDDLPQIKQSLVETAVSGPSTFNSPRQHVEPGLEKAMELHLESIRCDLEVSHQLVVELNKPPVEMVFVPKLLLQELKQHYESTLTVLNELLNQA